MFPEFATTLDYGHNMLNLGDYVGEEGEGEMESAILLSLVFVSMIYFANFIWLLKRIKENKDIAFNTVFGAVMTGYIVYAGMGLMMQN